VINNKTISELLKFSRTECGILVRALTGHWLVGTHAGRLKATKNDFCRSCRDEEEDAPQNDFCRSCRDEEEVKTVEHLLCFCPALCRLRMKHFGSPFIDDPTEIVGINLKNISAFMKSSGLKLI